MKIEKLQCSKPNKNLKWVLGKLKFKVVFLFCFCCFCYVKISSKKLQVLQGNSSFKMQEFVGNMIIKLQINTLDCWDALTERERHHVDRKSVQSEWRSLSWLKDHHKVSNNFSFRPFVSLHLHLKVKVCPLLWLKKTPLL